MKIDTSLVLNFLSPLEVRNLVTSVMNLVNILEKTKNNSVQENFTTHSYSVLANLGFRQEFLSNLSDLLRSQSKSLL